MEQPNKVSGFQIDPSYQLGRFRDNDDSLRRLESQASVALEMEFEELRHAGLHPGARVLDVGCGPGILTTELVTRGGAREVLGIDCNETSLATTRARLSRLKLDRVRVGEGNIYDPDLVKEGPFDFAYARLVFQHLSEPVFALSNLRQTLGPNGRLCVCDIDDRWLSIAPDVPYFESFIRRVGLAQKGRGGDRHVGAKLAHYMRCAGYTDIRSRTVLMSTDQIPKSTFCDLVLGYKEEVVPEEELVVACEELAKIRETLEPFHGWAGLGLFFVSGRPAPA